MTTVRICPACGWGETTWQHHVSCGSEPEAPAQSLPPDLPTAEAGEHRCPVCYRLHRAQPLTAAEKQRAYRERRKRAGRNRGA